MPDFALDAQRDELMKLGGEVRWVFLGKDDLWREYGTLARRVDLTRRQAYELISAMSRLKVRS